MESDGWGTEPINVLNSQAYAYSFNLLKHTKFNTAPPITIKGLCIFIWYWLTCFVWCSQITGIIFLYRFTSLEFIVQNEYVYCEGSSESLKISQMNFILHISEGQKGTTVLNTEMYFLKRNNGKTDTTVSVRSLVGRTAGWKSVYVFVILQYVVWIA